MLLASSAMNSSHAQADMLENASQNSLVDDPLYGTCDKDFAVSHTLIPEER